MSMRVPGTRNRLSVVLVGAADGVSPEALAARLTAHPDVDVYCAALDRQLNEKGYIMPGLGDAGDRQFGTGHGG